MTDGQIWGALALLTTAVVATVGFAVLTMVRFTRTVGDGLRSEIAALGATLGGEIGKLDGKLSAEIKELKGQLGGEIKELRGQLGGDIKELRGEIVGLRGELGGLDRDVSALMSKVMGPETG